MPWIRCQTASRLSSELDPLTITKEVSQILYKCRDRKLGWKTLKMARWKNSVFTDVIGVLTIPWVSHLWTTCLFLMILANKFLTTCIRDIMLQFLLMDRQAQESLTQLKVIKKKDCSSYASKTFLKERKNKIRKMESVLLSELHIFKFIMKNWETYWIQNKANK